MHRAVVAQLNRIRSLEGLEDATIAILVRDNAQFNRFERFRADSGITDMARFGDDHAAGARTGVGRIPDAEGLEYDAVIVMGVNETFRETLFNQKCCTWQPREPSATCRFSGREGSPPSCAR